jgi:hypothetical protein
MTLLELLTAVTFAAFFASAVATAKGAKAGIGGYALAIIIGLSLAICSAWVFYKPGGILANLTRAYSEKRQEWYGCAFFLFALLWLVVGAILTSLVTSAVMRLVA